MKGQRYRAFETANDRVFSAETSVELHISVETESVVNKDNADMNDYPEVVGYSFDMTVEQQVKSLTAGSENEINAPDINAGDFKHLQLARFNGASKEAIIVSGDFICTSSSCKADNKKVVTAIHKFEGTGALKFSE